jgi:alkanesulfonate monooxygenase SsuD/methylene tetrahydromethanopterin reductase-like flavin-dependent oxidoreductase (luciferase family)
VVHIEPEEIAFIETVGEKTIVVTKNSARITVLASALDLIALIWQGPPTNHAHRAQLWKECAEAWDEARKAAQERGDRPNVVLCREFHAAALMKRASLLQDQAQGGRDSKNNYVWRAKIAPC